MRILVTAFAGLSIAAATACAALAADTDMTLTEPTSQIENMSVDNVTGILKELGAQQIETHDVEGTKLITFKDGTTPFNFALGLCNVKPGTCLGLMMLVGFDPGTTHYPLDLFNTFNRDNTFVAVVQMDGNRFAVSRMLFTDGGVSKKNLAVNIAMFAAAPSEVLKFLQSQLVAGYEQGNAAQFQRASLGNTAPRIVPLSAQDVLAIMRAQHPPAPTPLRHQ